MRRYTAMVTALLLLTAACTDGDDEAAPEPVEEDEDGEEEDRLPPGLRVGVVLPPADVGVADEVDLSYLDFDGLRERLGDEVSELRTVVPDAGAFVPDVATLLAVEGYDVVCVFGRDAYAAVAEVAVRHAAATFCAAPVDAERETTGTVLHTDLALEELGHVVGVALGQLGGEDPVALLGTGDRTGGEAFRGGLRAGVGATPLREARGGIEELSAELDAALADEVAAVALDAGPDASELIEGGIGVPLLAPTPLLADVDGALRWQVRWDLVLEHVLGRHLEGDEGGTVEPERLGLRQDAFELHHGGQATSAMIAAVEQALGELERGERDPLASPDGDAADGVEADEQEGGA